MKKRADLLLVERGLVESRSRAAAVILAGKAFSGEQRVEKAGDLLPEDAPLELRGQDHAWVSRGGTKLAHGLDHFAIDPGGRICLEIRPSESRPTGAPPIGWQLSPAGGFLALSKVRSRGPTAISSI